MACECIRLTNEALAKDNLRLDTAYWFNRETGGHRRTVRIGTELVEKKRGQRPATMIPTFCPFCGVRYEPEADDARQHGGQEREGEGRDE